MGHGSRPQVHRICDWVPLPLGPSAVDPESSWAMYGFGGEHGARSAAQVRPTHGGYPQPEGWRPWTFSPQGGGRFDLEAVASPPALAVATSALLKRPLLAGAALLSWCDDWASMGGRSGKRLCLGLGRPQRRDGDVRVGVKRKLGVSFP
mmetsp:Transcript_36698/g.80445  ORF Transcript_36698/g.80445 Transcript_36698/m.80445 type:complete len:149 (+) Transcript_36698:3-449(+)